MPIQTRSQKMDTNQFVLGLIEALKDPQVIHCLNRAIDYEKFGNVIELKIGDHMRKLNDKLIEKDNEIRDLKDKVKELSESLDDLDQYGRKKSLRIDGVEEPADETDTHQKVVSLCNDALTDQVAHHTG